MISHIEIERIDPTNRDRVNAFLQQQWFSTTMILRGEEIDMRKAEGFFFGEDGAIIGLITYRVYGCTLEILSLDSLRENQGIGSRLLDLAIREARERKSKKVVLITTNGSIRAIRFYQRRGFDLIKLY